MLIEFATRIVARAALLTTRLFFELSRKGPPDLRLHRLGEYLAWWERWLG